jgi:hypothetical protein
MSNLFFLAKDKDLTVEVVVENGNPMRLLIKLPQETEKKSYRITRQTGIKDGGSKMYHTGNNGYTLTIGHRKPGFTRYLPHTLELPDGTEVELWKEGESIT